MTYLVHAAAWLVIAVCAALRGGSYTVFNCWPLAVLFPTPLAMVFWGGMAVWVLAALRAIFLWARSGSSLAVPIHLAIFTCGLATEAFVAVRFHAPASCL